MIKKNDFSTQGKSCNYLSSTAANLDTESSAKKHSSEVNTFNAQALENGNCMSKRK